MNTNKGALETVVSYDEKIRLMTLSVLREECGRELYNKARFNGEEFDWKTHNEEFNSEYGDLSFKELLKLCKTYYGLSTIDEVRSRKAAHRQQFNKRNSY